MPIKIKDKVCCQVRISKEKEVFYGIVVDITADTIMVESPCGKRAIYNLHHVAHCKDVPDFIPTYKIPKAGDIVKPSREAKEFMRTVYNSRRRGKVLKMVSKKQAEVLWNDRKKPTTSDIFWLEVCSSAEVTKSASSPKICCTFCSPEVVCNTERSKLFPPQKKRTAAK